MIISVGTSAMPDDERTALMADLRRYQELLSGTLDPVKLAAYGIIISRLEAKLRAMGPAQSASTSSDPAVCRPTYR